MITTARYNSHYRARNNAAAADITRDHAPGVKYLTPSLASVSTLHSTTPLHAHHWRLCFLAACLAWHFLEIFMPNLAFSSFYPFFSFKGPLHWQFVDEFFTYSQGIVHILMVPSIKQAFGAQVLLKENHHWMLQWKRHGTWSTWALKISRVKISASGMILCAPAGRRSPGETDGDVGMIKFTGDINFCELRPAIKIVWNGSLTADNDT